MTPASPRGLVLLSGGLDSMLAVRILQLQGINVEAVTFRTQFTCCKDQAARAAHELDVPLTVVSEQDDYLELIRHPRYGYGRGANPCVDCRIYMFKRARRLMDEIGAVLVASGEVVGQRPMSQKKKELAIIARASGLEDRLLRPLSAKLLPPTLAEREGVVDRERLYSFSGRSRKGLIALAQEFGFRSIPQPSTGCALTEPGFATKVHDLVQLSPSSGRWGFELLKIGRHVRYDALSKVVVGRRHEENQQIEAFFQRADAEEALLVQPDGFAGPCALLVGRCDEPAWRFAAALVLKHSKACDPLDAWVRISTPAGPHSPPTCRRERVTPLEAAELAVGL